MIPSARSHHLLERRRTTGTSCSCRGRQPFHLLRPRATSSPSPVASIAKRQRVEEVDLVIVGAGIVGLWTAYEALRRGASVALVDARRPCAGGVSAQATGAGQGYLWLAHREPPDPSSSLPTPSAASWHLAARGKARWERLANSSSFGAAPDPVAAALARRAELRRTGSLLLATTAEEAGALEARAARLCAAPGGPAESAVRVLATAGQVAADEPALGAPSSSSSSCSPSSLVRAALLVESDGQISGRGAALGLLDACRQQERGGAAGGGGRFLEALEDGVASITPAAGAGATAAGGAGAGVETASGRVFRARRGVVVAGGAWTGALLADALERAHGEGGPSSGGGGGGGGAAAAWRAFFAPRRGHLLEVDAGAANLPAPLRRGAMELSYARHYKDAGAAGAGGGDGHASGGGGGGGGDVTFTVTSGGADGSGPLLLGSSREKGAAPPLQLVAPGDGAGFDGRADGGVVAAILARAAEFLPSLGPLAARAARGGGGGGGLLDEGAVRVGLRPWAAGGLPAIGPVGPELPGVVVAAGHEGSGLVMAPATAELALRWVGIGGGEEEAGEEEGAWRRHEEAATAAELAPNRRLAAARRR